LASAAGDAAVGPAAALVLERFGWAAPLSAEVGAEASAIVAGAAAALVEASTEREAARAMGAAAVVEAAPHQTFSRLHSRLGLSLPKGKFAWSNPRP
jgi:hypothetical protein